MLFPRLLLSKLKVLSILCFPSHMSHGTIGLNWAFIKFPLASPHLRIATMEAEE